MTAKKTTKAKTAAAKKIAGAAEKVKTKAAERIAAAKATAAQSLGSQGLAAGSAAAPGFCDRVAGSLESPAPARGTGAENRQPGSGWKWAVILLLCLWGFSSVKGCVANLHQRYADWKQSVIQRLIPTPPNPFERKTRPDRNDGNDNDGGGIRWKFIRGVEGARSLASWVKRNVPAGVSASAVYDVADAFYDAADAIRAEPEFDEPAEAVAAVRGRLYGAADSAWVPFLSGLDQQANSYGVKSIGDVCSFYYAVADALYDAAAPRAEPLSAPNESEPSEAEQDQAPPTDSAALPPAEPDSSDAAENRPPGLPDCPNGSCPNQNPAPRTGYGYGYKQKNKDSGSAADDDASEPYRSRSC